MRCCQNKKQKPFQAPRSYWSDQPLIIPAFQVTKMSVAWSCVLKSWGITTGWNTPWPRGPKMYFGSWVPARSRTRRPCLRLDWTCEKATMLYYGYIVWTEGYGKKCSVRGGPRCRGMSRRGCGKCALKLLCVCLVGTVSSERSISAFRPPEGLSGAASGRAARRPPQSQPHQRGARPGFVPCLQRSPRRPLPPQPVQHSQQALPAHRYECGINIYWWITSS